MCRTDIYVGKRYKFSDLAIMLDMEEECDDYNYHQQLHMCVYLHPKMPKIHNTENENH